MSRDRQANEKGPELAPGLIWCPEIATRASVPAPTFASRRGWVESKCRRQRNTSNIMILV